MYTPDRAVVWVLTPVSAGSSERRRQELPGDRSSAILVVLPSLPANKTPVRWRRSRAEHARVSLTPFERAGATAARRDR
jgi:hypothetical protein